MSQHILELLNLAQLNCKKRIFQFKPDLLKVFFATFGKLLQCKESIWRPSKGFLKNEGFPKCTLLTLWQWPWAIYIFWDAFSTLFAKTVLIIEPCFFYLDTVNMHRCRVKYGDGSCCILKGIVSDTSRPRWQDTPVTTDH